MEKTVKIRNADINFTIWDLGGAPRCHAPRSAWAALLPSCSSVRAANALWKRCHPGHVAAGQDEFKSMMPMCCNDALAILFIFDLSRKSTLASIRKWFKESRRYSKARRPHLPRFGQVPPRPRPPCPERFGPSLDGYENVPSRTVSCRGVAPRPRLVSAMHISSAMRWALAAGALWGFLGHGQEHWPARREKHRLAQEFSLSNADSASCTTVPRAWACTTASSGCPHGGSAARLCSRKRRPRCQYWLERSSTC